MITHALTGVVLMLKGFTKLEHPAGYGAVIAVSMGGGLLILLGTAFHSRLEHRFPHFDITVYLVEAITCALVGLSSMQHGTRTIHYIWFVAAAAFLLAVVIRSVAFSRVRS